MLAVIDLFRDSLEEAGQCLESFRADDSAQRVLARLAEQICDCFRAGNKILVAGNGGSMADALHFAEELTGRFRADRKSLPAIALAEATHLSCTANDYGFEHVFSRLVESLGRPGDVLLLLSTSGNSANVVKAAQAGRAGGLVVASLLGKDGGTLRQLSDLVVVVPGATSDRIQEIHMLVLHILVEAVEFGLGLA